jgi:PleD family two-component response regulator
MRRCRFDPLWPCNLIRAFLDKGSMFWFEIPLMRTQIENGRGDSDDTTMTIIPGQQFKTDKTGAQLRVLVVDDVTVNQIVVEKMLDSLGYQVETAANGVEAVDAVKTRQYTAKRS